MGRVYDLRAWKRTRLDHLASEPLCRMCAAQNVIRPALHVDHITPISQGGDLWGPFQSLCAEHHSMKTAKENGKQVRMGCDSRGIPLDSDHHWSRKD